MTSFGAFRGTRSALRAAALILTFHATAGCVLFSPAPEVVSNVDLERYAGKWYEIARYPVRFQEGCVGVTAEYTLRNDGRVTVVNACFEGSLDGPLRTIEGVARVVDATTNARLGVRFFGPFEGPYWIIDLDPEYEWAVVSTPWRNMLWILSRSPQIDSEVYADILTRLEEKGFDTDRLIQTPQPAEEDQT